MKKLSILYLLFSIAFASALSQTRPVDEIIFGNQPSERKHHLTSTATQVVEGGLGESARRLLPIEGERVEGGNITFSMKVDPDKQNYFTARFWGSNNGNGNILILFCEGKQIGYRHLGDYDMLDISNNEAPFPQRFTYTTLPLPRGLTDGKTQIELSIRSTGHIYRYGDTFDAYQKPMLQPAKDLYKAYTHTDTYFAPPRKEKQGAKPPLVKRSTPGEEVIDEIKQHVNGELARMLAKMQPTQDELWVLSSAYHTPWTNVYHEATIIEKVIQGADDCYNRYAGDSTSVYRDSWITTGPLCIALYRFVPEITKILDEEMPNKQTRRTNWSQMLAASVEYAKTHRRQYTNQSMIVDLHLYAVNRMLSILAPAKALPAYQTLKYLYESMGIVPWLGSETPNGPSMPLSDNYYQLTDKGLTKELGFVGSYGEIMNWMTHIYEVTGEQGISDSRDPLIRAQLLKMFNARSYFRYPAVDSDGFSAMRAEAVIGWRDHGNYPGAVLYGEKANSRESTPLMATISTLDPDALAFAGQMMDDNQFFSLIRDKMKDRSLNSTQMLLRIPQEYEIFKTLPSREGRLPMSEGMPDVLFSDEEVGVVALRNGDEIFYASLYWRANYAINFLARVHYITPQTDHIATVYQDVKFADSGMIYTRPERVNLHFSDARQFYRDVKSAHTGEQLPIARIPDGIKFKPGNENVYAGKGDFYTLRFGKYLIAMNCTTTQSFELEIPRAAKVLEFPAKTPVTQSTIRVSPRTTLVLLIE